VQATRCLVGAEEPDSVETHGIPVAVIAGWKMDVAMELIAKIKNLYPRDFEFPTAPSVPIPNQRELALYGFAWSNLTIDDVLRIRPSLDMAATYALVTFGVRAAIRAVRSGSGDLVTISALSLLLDDAVLDWRDVIVALAIVEDCANRLHLNLKEVMDRYIRLATEQRKQTVSQGWFSRPAAERTPSVGGFLARIGPGGLEYVRAF
jgi:hypothetical protein